MNLEAMIYRLFPVPASEHSRKICLRHLRHPYRGGMLDSPAKMPTKRDGLPVPIRQADSSLCVGEANTPSGRSSRRKISLGRDSLIQPTACLADRACAVCGLREIRAHRTRCWEVMRAGRDSLSLLCGSFDRSVIARRGRTDMKGDECPCEDLLKVVSVFHLPFPAPLLLLSLSHHLNDSYDHTR